MKTVVIANPRAGSGRVGNDWAHLAKSIERVLGGPLETQFTERPNQGTELARQALRDGIRRIVAVGGDGTVNEILNGFEDNGVFNERDASLVVVPVGTGGDFARSIGLAKTTVQTALSYGSERKVDVGRCEVTRDDGSTTTRYFLNISSFGSSGLVVDLVNKSSKRFGAKASFMWGTLKALAAYRNQKVRLRVDDVFDEELRINTVAVANGRYFGGAMKVAPGAFLNDGTFEVVVVGDISLPQILRYSPDLYRGTHIGKAGVRRISGKTVIAEPIGGERVLVDLDGEQPGILPVRYTILPQALRLYAPWHNAEALAQADAV